MCRVRRAPGERGDPWERSPGPSGSPGSEGASRVAEASSSTPILFHSQVEDGQENKAVFVGFTTSWRKKADFR